MCIRDRLRQCRANDQLSKNFDAIQRDRDAQKASLDLVTAEVARLSEELRRKETQLQDADADGFRALDASARADAESEKSKAALVTAEARVLALEKDVTQLKGERDDLREAWRSKIAKNDTAKRKLDATQAKARELEAQEKECTIKLERASKLIGGLWIATLAKEHPNIYFASVSPGGIARIGVSAATSVMEVEGRPATGVSGVVVPPGGSRSVGSRPPAVGAAVSVGGVATLVSMGRPTSGMSGSFGFRGLLQIP